MTTPPLCINCVFSSDARGFGLHRCVRGLRQVGTDPVDGRPIMKADVSRICMDERRRSVLRNSCGPTGKHYQPRDMGVRE